MLILYTIIGLTVFGICSILIKKHFIYSSFSGFIFILFFHNYGLMFNFFNNIDLTIIEHYNFLPIFILFSIYCSTIPLFFKLTTLKKMWLIFIVIILFLCAFNIFQIIIIKTDTIKGQNLEQSLNNTISSENDNFPDIYYLIFDEFSGFEAMREYWNNSNVDRFVERLSTTGFIISENSHSSSIDTLHQMATRLNFKDYELGSEFINQYYQDIANNKVLQFVKNYGYTTIVFDQTRVSFAYPAKPSINSDYYYDHDPALGNTNSRKYFDEFGQLIADKTVLLGFSKYYKINNPEINEHIKMLNFTKEKLGMVKMRKPIFVHAHLLMPHMPFIFDEEGNYVDQTNHKNWDYYEGYYLYTIKYIDAVINNILLQYDNSNQPVIILQSDHGARNKGSSDPNSKILEHYPEEYKTLIMNAIYAPFCNSLNFPNNAKPINTFPIIFNCIFNAKIPLK